MNRKKSWSPGLDVRNIEITSPKFDSDNLLDTYPQFLFVDYSHRNNPAQQVLLSETMVKLLPLTKPSIDWNAKARERFGTNANMESVKALLKKMLQAGINIGVYGADGKWGSASEKAYQEYLEKLRILREQEIRLQNKNYAIIVPKQNITPSTPESPTMTLSTTNNENWFRTTANVFKNSKGFGLNLYNMFNTMADWRDDGWLTKTYKNHIYLQPGRTTSHKVGGKFLQGGTMQNEQELQKAFMAFLIEDAAAQGMLIQSEQDLQAYALQLGEEGLKAKYQEFMLKMQGGVKARLGAKLDYINKLKGNCPDGSEPYYFKEGGSMKKGCKPCMLKASGGTNTKEFKPKGVNEIDKFKNRRINPSDTVWVDGDKKKARTLTDDRGKPIVKGMKSYSTTEYQKDMARGKKGDKAAARRVEKQNEKTMYGCGAKLKKKK